jgi:hypothetical protein
MKLLHVDSSILGANSVSRAVTEAVVDRLLDPRPERQDTNQVLRRHTAIYPRRLYRTSRWRNCPAIIRFPLSLRCPTQFSTIGPRAKRAWRGRSSRGRRWSGSSETRHVMIVSLMRSARALTKLDLSKDRT